MAVSGLEHGKGRNLWDYWTTGEGAAKIGWGAPGDYDRCVAEISKYDAGGAHGLCSTMHIHVTGMTTAEHAAREGGRK